MADKRDVILEKKKSEKSFVRETETFKGIIIARAGSVNVPGIKNHVWFLPNDDNEPMAVFNRRVKARNELPVVVGYVQKSKILEILGTDVENLAGYEDVSGLDIMPHASTHRRGGDDPLDIDRRMITDQLYLYPNSGLTVGISPLEYDLIGSRVFFPGLISKDLTGSKPASGLARWVLVYLDTADNTIKVVNGGTVQDFDWIIPTKPDTPEGGIAAGYVRLDGSQTSIVEADIDDGRRSLVLLDHGALSGLADDDHTQYLRADGSRAGATDQAQEFTNDILPAGSSQGLNSRFENLFGDDVPAAPNQFTRRSFQVDAQAGDKLGFETDQASPYAFSGPFSASLAGGDSMASTKHWLTFINGSGGSPYLDWNNASAKTVCDLIFSTPIYTAAGDTLAAELRLWAVQTPGATDKYWALRWRWMPATYPQWPLRLGRWYGTGVTFSLTDGTLSGSEFQIVGGLPYKLTGTLYLSGGTTPAFSVDLNVSEGMFIVAAAAGVAGWPTSFKCARLYVFAQYYRVQLDEVTIS